MDVWSSAIRSVAGGDKRCRGEMFYAYLKWLGALSELSGSGQNVDREGEERAASGGTRATTPLLIRYEKEELMQVLVLKKADRYD
ncbi:hypothetical protein OPV22_033438 [Ensete ventricosum]|uniref:Uncharacterized protein n=1 Tax=Ensete ventricosum TaxID=4639 RepID=A0AAV8PZH4_ENSVE|nr:hypothetical protein OPV22_033438 [Ensete ventricosum]